MEQEINRNRLILSQNRIRGYKLAHAFNFKMNDIYVIHSIECLDKIRGIRFHSMFVDIKFFNLKNASEIYSHARERLTENHHIYGIMDLKIIFSSLKGQFYYPRKNMYPPASATLSKP